MLYKPELEIDAKSVSATSTQLKDMHAVLKEIGVSYSLLLETLDQQQRYISSPSIDAYRLELQRQLGTAIKKSRNIVERTQKLAIVSEEASKHLTAFEEHYSAALQKQLQTVGKE